MGKRAGSPERAASGRGDESCQRLSRAWWPWWAWSAALVLLLDQITKWLALTRLDPGAPVALLPGLNLRLAFNRGVAFSLFDGTGAWRRWALSGLAAAIALLVLAVLWREHRQRPDTAGLGLSLVLGGALGNLTDRLRLGVVVDFIDCYLGRWHWPAFNLADSAITVGALLLVLSIWRGSGPRSGVAD